MIDPERLQQKGDLIEDVLLRPCRMYSGWGRKTMLPTDDCSLHAVLALELAGARRQLERALELLKHQSCPPHDDVSLALPIDLTALERGLLRKEELYDLCAEGRISLRRTPLEKLAEIYKDPKKWPASDRRKLLAPSRPEAGQNFTPSEFKAFVQEWYPEHGMQEIIPREELFPWLDNYSNIPPLALLMYMYHRRELVEESGRNGTEKDTMKPQPRPKCRRTPGLPEAFYRCKAG